MLAAAAAVGVLGWTTFAPGRGVGPEGKPLDDERCGAPVESPGRLPDTLRVDPVLQAFAQDLLDRHPDVLTVAVGLDLRTARPLFLATRSGRAPVGSDLPTAVSPQYPFASLAKILTSVAAMSEAGYTPWSSVWLRGNAHTLYKGQLRSDSSGTEMPLAAAFAYSVNPVFGKLGVHTLGREAILRWADSLGFNRPGGLGNGVPSGRLAAPVDSYNLAEVSSGFVRTTLGSPVQAAMIARALVHDGRLRPPAWSASPDDTLCPPQGVPATGMRHDILTLFRWTVDSGTARGGFASAWPRDRREGFDLGGKTGSLDGTDPPGRYEWFAGFARVAGEPDSGIAVAVLTVNDRFGSLSASWTAAALLHAWARRVDQPVLDPVPVQQAKVAGSPLLTDLDRDALAERAWHRAWVRRSHRPRCRH